MKLKVIEIEANAEEMTKCRTLSDALVDAMKTICDAMVSVKAKEPSEEDPEEQEDEP